MITDDDIPVMTLDQARRVLVLLGIDRGPRSAGGSGMTPDKRNGPAGDGTGSVNQQAAGQASNRVTRTPDRIRQVHA